MSEGAAQGGTRLAGAIKDLLVRLIQRDPDVRRAIVDAVKEEQKTSKTRT